jgi:AGZA family xanthine/uracil permease-like MFS transporter
MFTFLFTDFFDTVGTLVGVSSRADFRDEERRLPTGKQALMADAIATCAGAVMGTSTVTAYVESASGVEEGGKTELTSVIVAGLFLLAIFISPRAAVIPGYATSPALIMVGISMIQSLRYLDFETWTEIVPAAVIILIMTFSYSITEGIIWGIISYTRIKVGSGKFKDISLIMVFLSLVFLLKEIYL